MAMRLRLSLTLVMLVGACTLPNPDHCLHRAADADGWCAQVDPARPYCSPCASEHHGCVAELPLECPAYSPAPSESDESTSDESSESSAGASASDSASESDSTSSSGSN